MSAAAVNTYRGKIDRGTMTLAQIDAAERGKLVTAAEANTLRAYWHTVYDLTGLSLAAEADRSQRLSWNAPTGVHNLELTRTVGGTAQAPLLVPCAPGHYTLPADVGDAEVSVEVRAVVSNAVNAYLGAEATASTTVPAAPEPEPTPEPTPEPEAPAAEVPDEQDATGEDTPAADA